MLVRSSASTPVTPLISGPGVSCPAFKAELPRAGTLPEDISELVVEDGADVDFVFP